MGKGGKYTADGQPLKKGTKLENKLMYVEQASWEVWLDRRTDTDRYTCKQTDIQSDRQADRQTDREVDNVMKSDRYTDH